MITVSVICLIGFGLLFVLGFLKETAQNVNDWIMGLSIYGAIVSLVAVLVLCAKQRDEYLTAPYCACPKTPTAEQPNQ